MSPRLAWLFITTLALPALACAQAEDEIVSAIRSRLEANRHNDMATWAKFVADDMMAPMEGATRSKQSRMAQQKAWPREVTYSYGPLQDLKVRVNGDTAIVTYHADQFTEIGGQTTSVHKWQIETHVRRDGRWLLLGVAETTFFVPGAAAGGDTSRMIFVKDAGGRVTHYIYRELGGTDRIVKRIK